MKSVDEPESPSFSPDGTTDAFAALRGGIGDIYTVDLATSSRNLTNDDFADYAPSTRRRQVHDLQRARQRQPEAVPAGPRHEEEDAAHFGTVDETAAQFSTTTRSCSRRPRPIRACRSSRRSPRTATSQHLDARSENGELRQYTDALGGNWSAVVLNEGKTNRIASSATTRASTDPHARTHGAAAHGGDSRLRRAGPIIDFQAPLQHTLVRRRSGKKGTSRRCSSRAGRR
jgi:hypothetical protein